MLQKPHSHLQVPTPSSIDVQEPQRVTQTPQTNSKWLNILLVLPS